MFAAGCSWYYYSLIFSGGLENKNEQSAPWRCQQCFAHDVVSFLIISKSIFRNKGTNRPVLANILMKSNQYKHWSGGRRRRNSKTKNHEELLRS